MAPIFFLVWAVAFTYPLALHFTDSVILSRGSDAWLHLWDLWWVDKSLVSLHQLPYQTTYLYYPTGLNLYYHSLDLLNALVSIPFQHIFGLTVSFNLVLLANLTLDGWIAYILCRERTGSALAGLAGGALFASAPLLGASVSLGQLDEVTVWWVPLYLLALFRVLDSPGAIWRRGGGRRAILCAGLCLAGASLATWYFTAGLVIFTIIFVPLYLLTVHASARQYTARLLNVALKVTAGVALFALLLSPLLYAMIRERLSGATYMISTLQTTLVNSTDLLALFIPVRFNPPAWDLHNEVNLGYLLLALAGIGIVARRRAAWPLAVAVFVIVLMSLGPRLQIGGANTELPMPYSLLDNVPFIGASRQPLRFLAAAGAVLALLAAYGVAWLLEHAKTANMRSLVVAGVLFLTVLELFGVPRDVVSTQSGPAYAFLHDQPGPGAVLEVPSDNYSALSLLHQSVTDRPIIGGYTSRHFPYPFAAAPAVSQLVAEDPDPLTSDDILDPPVPDTAASSLAYYGVRFIVVHKADMATGRYGHLDAVLSALFGDVKPLYEDDEVKIYDSSQVRTSQGSGVLPLVGLGTGWHKAEQTPLHRWTGNDVTDGNALVWIGIPPGGEGDYKLDMTAYSSISPRHLSLVLDGQRLFQKQIGTDFATLSVDLGHLGTGNHILTLDVQEPPENPPDDPRKIALGVTSLAVSRSGP